MIHPLDLQPFLPYLAPRRRDTHKGDFGRLLVIGGDIGYAGAVLLTGKAALRVGAGAVTIATHPEHAAMLTAYCPELMCHGVTSANDLTPLLRRATAIVIGPGLGLGEWGAMLWKHILNTQLPLLVDADALTLLSHMPSPPTQDWVLTPHPGEAARLLKTTAHIIQADRPTALSQLHRAYGGTVVLKGAGTLVLSDDKKPVICMQGNPGMATAGMGDVLSGVIGGLLAQNIPSSDAAQLGVLLHAMAGDKAAEAGERGLIASDVIEQLRGVMRRVN